MRRRTDNLVGVSAFIAFLCLLAILYVGSFVLRNSNRIDEVALGQCRRVQVERERSNVAEATIYAVLAAASKTAVSEQARRVYADQAAATAWSPPANCRQAVQDPTGYRLPRSIPFSRLPDDYAARVVDAAKAGRPQPLP